MNCRLPMKPVLLILACSIACAADLTIVVTPTPSNVVITITMPAVVTDAVVKSAVALPDAVVAVSTLPDARASLPRSVPMPPMPPVQVPVRIKDWQGGNPAAFTWKTITKDAPWLTPLPRATNHPSYAHHHAQWLADRAAVGKRRSE